MLESTDGGTALPQDKVNRHIAPVEKRFATPDRIVLAQTVKSTGITSQTLYEFLLEHEEKLLIVSFLPERAYKLYPYYAQAQYTGEGELKKVRLGSIFDARRREHTFDYTHTIPPNDFGRRTWEDTLPRDGRLYEFSGVSDDTGVTLLQRYPGTRLTKRFQVERKHDGDIVRQYAETVFSEDPAESSWELVPTLIPTALDVFSAVTPLPTYVEIDSTDDVVLSISYK